MAKEIKDVYFRRAFIPIVVTILILMGIFVIIVAVPDTALEWETYSTVAEKMIGGAVRRIRGAVRQ